MRKLLRNFIAIGNKIVGRTFLSALLLGVIAVSTSCRKTSTLQNGANPAVKSVAAVDVNTLKDYLSKLTSVSVDKISYDGSTKQFRAFGKDQISLQELTEFYKKIPGYTAKQPSGRGKTVNVHLVICDTCSTTEPPRPPLPPYADVADTILDYNTNLTTFNLVSTTIHDYDLSSTNFTDINQGAVLKYFAKTTGSGNGSVSGNDIYVRYGQSQTLKITVRISIPHLSTGGVATFKVDAGMGLSSGNLLNPTFLQTGALSVSQRDVDTATNIFMYKTFNVSIPTATATADIDGKQIALYWANSSSSYGEKILTDPIYTIHVQGIPQSPNGIAPATEQTGPIINLYRMYFAPGGEHFYTVGAGEKQALLNEYSLSLPDPGFSFHFNSYQHWNDEGTIGKLYNYHAQNTVALFRLFNSSNAVHMYTADPIERDNLINNLGYHSEGILGYVYSTPQPNTYAVYRYRGTSSVGHFFTTNYNEIGSGGPGFVFEGVSFYTLQ